jgi:hypothetical protein
MSQADVVRGLKIKTNTLKRLHKELSYYRKEEEREKGRVEQMKAGGADPHDLRQAVRARGAAARSMACDRGRSHWPGSPAAPAGLWQPAATGSPPPWSHGRACCGLVQHVGGGLPPAPTTSPGLPPQENVLAESAMMVPETRQRLEAALSELQTYMVSPAPAWPAALCAAGAAGWRARAREGRQAPWHAAPHAAPAGPPCKAPTGN